MLKVPLILLALAGIICVHGQESGSTVAAHLCPPNETFNDCGRVCEKNCSSNVIDENCVKKCDPPACTCDEGFVRHERHCVLPDQCIQKEGKQQKLTDAYYQCPPHETLDPCGQVCEKNCSHIGDDQCYKRCDLPACTCDKGHQLKLAAAQVKCVLNETFHECGRVCEKNCSQVDDKECTKRCDKAACTCKEGFERHEGVCILTEECVKEGQRLKVTAAYHHHRCPPNETFHHCGRVCEENCNSTLDEKCVNRCDPPACTCNKGFVRLDDHCVLPEECAEEEPTSTATPHPCPPNEILNGCGQVCERNCSNVEDHVCISHCDPPACSCEKGFVRYEGHCVLPDQCLQGGLQLGEMLTNKLKKLRSK